VKSYSVDDISQKGDPSFTSFMVKMMDPQTLKLPSTYNQDGYYYNTPCEILSDEMYERDVHEAFQQKLLENMPDERLQISIDDSFVQRYKAQQIDHLRAVLRKDRLTLITGKSELYFEIEALIERDTPIDPETLDELYWDTDLEHLFGVVDNYSRTIAYLQAQSSIEVFIVRTPKYLKNHYVKPYARNKIAIVKLEGLASFWYNKGTKKIIDPEASRFPATLVEMLLHETKELQPI
jgi:hypothetical protein